MIMQVAEQLNRIALPALAGAALFAGTFLVTLRKRRRA
jgi:LPXTG-motif cell wall-anchored protein